MQQINLTNQQKNQNTESILENDFSEKIQTELNKGITKKQKIVFLVSFSLLCVLLIAVSIKTLYPKFVIAPNEAINSSFIESEIPSDFVESTPFPFQELTIPYLKKRTYQSQVGELTKYNSQSNYESFLTSYDSDGLQINGLLTIPTTQKPENGYPAIVFIHGYIPPTLYRTEENYASYVDYFASRGFVVFKIDLRGHDESEGEASGAYYSGDYVVDVLNAYSALENMSEVDSSKIGLWGHSMAGNVVFRALAVKPNIPKVVIWAGAVYTYDDFAEFGIDDNSYRPPGENTERQRKRDELFNLYGRYSNDSWFWQQVPATNYLDGVAGAVQVHHAINDTVVGIGYSRNLMSVLDKTQVPHELFEYQSGGHNLTGSAFIQAMQRSVDFYLQ